MMRKLPLSPPFDVLTTKFLRCAGLVLIGCTAMTGAWILPGCSSVQEVAVQQSSTPVATATDTAKTAAVVRDTLLPRPASNEQLTPVPDGNSSDYRSLLDRAKLHLILAGRAMAKSDSMSAFKECEQAAGILEKAGRFLEAENDSLFSRLSMNLAGIYQQCSSSIPGGNFDLPAVALRGIFGASIKADTTDLSKLNFTAPPPTTIPLPLNELVERNIVSFTTRARGTMGRWLERSGRYFPIMKPILKEEGAPDELIYLSMIESGLNPVARSWAKCVGLWQFLKSTGESYGLNGDFYFDDRRNPEKATRAAARHLLDLYHRFHDWHLALAAYNCGSGRVERAIAASRLSNPTYWEILPYLPPETQNYVPIYIAAAIIALNPEAYDFVQIDYMDPLRYEPFKCSKSYKVEDLAACAGISVDEFTEMNPHLLQNFTPANRENFELRIPKGNSGSFAAKLKEIHEVDLAEVGVHRAKKGETLASVARKYKITVEELMESNNISRRRALRKGEMLRVPASTQKSSNLTAMDNVRSTSKRSTSDSKLRNTRGRKQLWLTVDKGMTLGKLADKYNCRVSDIMAWNSMKSHDVLKSGQNIVIWEQKSDTLSRSVATVTAPPAERSALPLVKAKSASSKSDGTTHHKVQKGETLAGIATMFGVTIDNLVKWNNLRSRTVHSGRVLTIRPSAGSPAGVPLYDSTVHAAPAAAPAPIADAQPAKADLTHASNATHVIRAGETLWSISEMYDVTPGQIREWNNIRGDAIQVGKSIVIRPVKPARQAAKKKAVKEDPKKYVVQQGEGIWGIAQAHDIPADSLVAWNNLSSKSLKEGQVLTLVPPPAAGAKPETYTVTAHDKLSSIARKFKIDMNDLRVWNDIKGNDIREGQVLRLCKPVAPAVHAKSTVRVQGSSELVPHTYMVEAGETLYGISRKLGVKVEDLRTWNNIKNDIRIGQKLVWYDSTVD